MNKLPFIKKGYTGPLHFSQSHHTPSPWALVLYIIFIFIVFALLSIRLFQLTIVKGTYYRRLSEENRVREMVIEPQRGSIIDRTGTVIVHNTPGDINTTVDERIVSKRHYKYGEEVGHIIGYRQIADNHALETDNCINKLQLSDKTGIKGVEGIYDCVLRGKAGKKLVELDARGKYLRTLSISPPQDGQTLQLSLDMELQSLAYSLLKDKKGSVIGTDPYTGEVIFMASNPSYNPAAFEDNINTQIEQYLQDKDRPLFNRATFGVYPPGSVFKMVVAAAALEEKKVTAATTVEDTGIIKAGQASFGNWYFLQYGKKEGAVNLVKALQRSNDIYFYKIGEKVGPQQIKKWAEAFGYAKHTNIGLDEEEGTMPSPFWKEEILKEKWYLGDTYNYSIGQGYALTTPLQVNQASAVFANGGYLCKPLLLKTDTQHNIPNQKPQCAKLSMSKETYEVIREGMRKACAIGGTGWPFFDFKPIVGCKTGTAESVSGSGKPHAWFTAFAPYDKPKIMITVHLEEAGQGSDEAAPIAKELMKKYFEIHP